MEIDSDGVVKPVGWMRKWAFDGETPHKEKNAKGRWAWPGKFKLLAVTVGKCLPDDVPLYPHFNSHAVLPRVVEAAREILNSGVEFDDARLNYISMQVDRQALAMLIAALKAVESQHPLRTATNEGEAERASTEAKSGSGGDSDAVGANSTSIHLAHCYDGEWRNSCKYGDANCPARPPGATPLRSFGEIQTEWLGLIDETKRKATANETKAALTYIALAGNRLLLEASLSGMKEGAKHA